MKERLIRFDPFRCTQCHGCEVACRSWRELPPGLGFRRVLNLWQGSYPTVRSSSLSLACLHCVEPACQAACPTGAIAKSPEDGRVSVTPGLCVGCGACGRACPFGVPQFGSDRIMQKCDLCADQTLGGGDPPCVETCPGKALSLETLTPEAKRAVEGDTLSTLRS